LDSEIFEQLKKLKMEYERLRDQSLLTHHPRHSLAFEQALRDYKQFILDHKISDSAVSESLHNPFLEDQDDHFSSSRPVRFFVNYQRPSLTHPRNIKAQKEIMDFMENQDGFKNINEIVPHLSIQISQTHRHLYSLTEQGKLIMREINSLQYWCRNKMYE
jgi:hypothetical protein